MTVERLPLGERILAGEGPEFAELLQSLREAIIVRDREDRFVYANRTALRAFGYASLPEMIGAPLHDLLDRFRVLDERGRPVSRDMIPSVRLLETGVDPVALLVQTIARGSGETRWHILRARPLHGDDGAVAAAVTMIEDVTAVKTAEIRTAILAESGRLLSASLDYQETLRNVAGVALPGLADWCLVELVEDRQREQVVVAHVDPEQRDLVRQLRALDAPEPGPESALRQVLATGRAVLHHEVPDAHLRRISVSDRQLEIYRELGIRSAIVVPMTTPTRTIGAMSFLTSVSGRRLGEGDVALAEQLGRRAAVAVENARLHTTLQNVASTLQDSLLPTPLPAVAGWEIGALYRPALEQPRIEVGGDFYEVFDTDGNAFATIGDVTGHGIHAATITSLLRHGARFASHLEPDPVAIIRRLDEELRRRDDGAMATALCAALHDRSVLLCSAGHPPALVVDSGGHVREAPTTGPLLGAFPDSSWHQERVRIADGDLVLMYTDGVSETVGVDDRFGTERLTRFLADHAGSAPQALLRALEAELEHFRGGPPTDDVAALALRPRAR